MQLALLHCADALHYCTLRLRYCIAQLHCTALLDDTITLLYCPALSQLIQWIRLLHYCEYQ